MHKVFDVELSSENGSTELALPATPYALADALEKLWLEEREAPRWEILRMPNCGQLAPYLDHSSTLFELNTLTQRLTELSKTEAAIVEGLAKMEIPWPGNPPVPIPRLIDLAYNTDCCHLLEGVVTDAQLGRFCAENGFVPETEGLSDAAFELLDFDRIGREFREAEGGVFTSGGYVQRRDELKQVYRTLNLSPGKPDYIILAETTSGERVKLPFPVNEPMGTEPVRCVDCAAPALIGIAGGMERMDLLARRLSGLEEAGDLPKYKALLEAVHCDDALLALSLVDGLDQYTFSPNLLEPMDVAMECLKTMLPDDAVKLLAPYVDLPRYGQAVLEQTDGQLTSYGLIQRVDGDPILNMAQKPTAGEMEIM